MKRLFLQEPETRLWLLKLLIIVLLFILLMWSVWWYFEYRMTLVKADTHL